MTRDLDELLAVADARHLAASGRGREIRERAGLTATALAEVCGVDVSTVTRWESGERRPSGRGARTYAGVLRALERQAEASAEEVGT